ncbi:MAG: hypothetical protein DRO11_07335, partial [Methanobacteriota archaeon]
MKHVVHLTTVHQPFDVRIFYRECKTLAQAGYCVSLIAPHTAREVVDGVEIIPIPRFTHRLPRMSQGVWAIYWLARRMQADLYHFHDPELLPVGICLKQTTSSCVVYDVHENHPQKILAKRWVPLLVRHFASWSVSALERVAASVVDGIVTATGHIAMRFPREKTQVVRNYPALSTLGLAMERQRVYEGNYTLIYTGGWTDHRGIYQIIQALAYVKTPQARLVLLGRTIDHHIVEAARKLPGFRRVDYRGYVPYEVMY